MAIVWTADLAVGVPEIDAQHQELFRRIDQLLEASHQGKGKEVVLTTVKFLEQYVVTHFQNEDQAMSGSHYPDRLKHLEEHRCFIQNFQELKQRIEKDGVNVHTIILTNRVVVKWLTHHILTVDKALGQYLREEP